MKTLVLTGSPSRADANGRPQNLYYDKLPKESRWEQLRRSSSFERQFVNMARPTSAVQSRSNKHVTSFGHYTDDKGGSKLFRPTSSYGSKGKSVSTAAVTNP